jgi:cytidine deaminase
MQADGPVPEGDPATGASLLKAAMAARANAHAPYSGYAVGAAVLAADGRVFAGCNVENAAYPVGTCAEAGALAAMVGAGPGGSRRFWWWRADRRW